MLTAATILHYVYGSLDLANHFFRAYDQRTGETLSALHMVEIAGNPSP